MRNKMRPDPVQIWMLEATNDDLCQQAWSPPWAVHPPGSSSYSSSRSCASRGGVYAPGIKREEIEELVPLLSAIHPYLLAADAKLLADALELQVEWLYRTTTLYTRCGATHCRKSGGASGRHYLLDRGNDVFDAARGSR
jgi:hypothetical protein